MPRHTLLFIPLFFFSLAPASAQPAFSWKDSVMEARKNHPDLISAAEQISGSRAQTRQAASSLWPQVSADAGAQTTKGPRSSSTSATTNTDKVRTHTYSYGLSADLLVFDGFQTAAEIEQAAKGIDLARYNYDVTSSNVRQRLRSAFIGLLKAQELLKITENIAVRRKRSRDLIQLRYEAGRENKGSLYTSEANLTQADFEVEQAKRGIALSQRRLSKEMGHTQLFAVQADGTLELEGLDRQTFDFEKFAETTPFLQALIVQKEAAKWGLASAKAAFFPQIFVGTSLGRSDSRWPPRNGRGEWSSSLTASVPLFEGGNLVAGVDEAGAVLAQSQADERSGRDGVILTLEETWTELQNAADQVDVQKKFVEAARERSKIAEAQYSAGLLTFNEWIIIEDNLVKAEKVYLDAKATALLAQADWDQARGETLDEA